MDFCGTTFIFLMFIVGLMGWSFRRIDQGGEVSKAAADTLTAKIRKWHS